MVENTTNDSGTGSSWILVQNRDFDMPERLVLGENLLDGLILGLVRR